MKKNIRWIHFILLLVVCLLGVPSLGVQAAEKLQYVYMSPTENGAYTGVVVSLDGENVKTAKLIYQGGTLNAARIVDSYLVFLVPGTGMDQNSLKTLELTTKTGKETIDLKAFFKDSGTEAVDPYRDNSIASSRSMGTSDNQNEELVESLTADGSGQIGQVLSQAGASRNVSLSGSGSGSIVIVLDPGHGGAEYGAVRIWNGISYIEKDITLKISRYTKQELETYAGVTVYLTRDSDVELDRKQRVDFAASKNADAIISQHINSTSKQQDTVSGAMVFISNGNYRPSLKWDSWTLGQTILDELSGLGLKDLGLVIENSHTGDTYPDGSLADYYGIIRYSVLAGFPGIIVEHGFVNNPEDCVKYYGSEVSIKQMGVKDAQAIAKYYGLKKKTTDPVTPGWQQENGKYWYLKSDGSRATGWLTLGTSTYYLDKNGYRVTGFHKIGSYTYYFDENGIRQTGLVRVNDSLYWMNNLGRRKTGWFTGFDGNQYYADREGKLRTGFVTRKGLTYYFDPVTGAMLKKFQTIDGKLYYFRSKTGEMLKDGFQRVGKYRYYFHSDGHAQVGLFSYNGERYYFRENGSMVKSAWIRYRKRWYFASSKGKFYRNTTRYIKGRKYQFNYKGVCMNKD